MVEDSAVVVVGWPHDAALIGRPGVMNAVDAASAARSAVGIAFHTTPSRVREFAVTIDGQPNTVCVDDVAQDILSRLVDVRRIIEASEPPLSDAFADTHVTRLETWASVLGHTVPSPTDVVLSVAAPYWHNACSALRLARRLIVPMFCAMGCEEVASAVGTYLTQTEELTTIIAQCVAFKKNEDELMYVDGSSVFISRGRSRSRSRSKSHRSQSRGEREGEGKRKSK